MTHTFQFAGCFTVQLSVFDDSRAEGTDTALITIDPPANTVGLPVADAGPDLMLEPGEFGELQGSATDPDGDPIVAWFWTLCSRPTGSSPNLTDPNHPTPDFSGDLEGDYILSLVASDATGWGPPDLVTITVTEPVTIPALPPLGVVILPGLLAALGGLALPRRG